MAIRLVDFVEQFSIIDSGVSLSHRSRDFGLNSKEFVQFFSKIHCLLKIYSKISDMVSKIRKQVKLWNTKKRNSMKYLILTEIHEWKKENSQGKVGSFFSHIA